MQGFNEVQLAQIREIVKEELSKKSLVNLSIEKLVEINGANVVTTEQAQEEVRERLIRAIRDADVGVSDAM